MSTRKYYLYIDRTDNGECFYVGCGSEWRATRAHLSPQRYNQRWQNVAKMFGVNRTILGVYSSKEEAHMHERLMIEHFHTYVDDDESSPFASNMTTGGDAAGGFRRCSFTKASQSAYASNRPQQHHDRMVAARWG